MSQQSGIVSRVAKPRYFKRVSRPHARNSVLRLRSLHARDFSPKQLERNSRGIRQANVAKTIAQVPSLYYWLSTRCGVSFAEARALVEQRRLFVNQQPVTLMEDLEVQRLWDDLEEQQCSILALGTDELVPALQRDRHRFYALFHLGARMHLTSDATDPRSFVHRVASASSPGSSSLESSASPSSNLNLVRVAGFANGMSGATVITDDISCVEYYNNHELGNFGTFEVTLPRGAPAEEANRVLRVAKQALSRLHYSPDLEVPLHCDLTAHPEGGGDRYKLLVETPYFPRVLWQRLKHIVDGCVCTSCGPFILPDDLPVGHARVLVGEEREAFFRLEKKFKTNRLVYSLRETAAAAGDGEEGGEE